MRLSRNASGSSKTSGNSNSIASSNTRGGSQGTSVRRLVPHALRCSSSPRCPKRRLGQRGLELQRKACGTSRRTLVPCDPPLVFEEAMELEFPLVLLEPLAFLLSRMLDQLCARLRARSLAAQEIHLEMTLENGRQQDSERTVFQRAIHLPVPMLDAKTFLKL